MRDFAHEEVISRPQKWSKSEASKLVALWPMQSIDKIAAELGRTSASVAVKACRIGLEPHVKNGKHYKGVKHGMRKCLCCTDEFRSEGIHNRICSRCKERSEFKVYI